MGVRFLNNEIFMSYWEKHHGFGGDNYAGHGHEKIRKHWSTVHPKLSSADRHRHKRLLIGCWKTTIIKDCFVF